MIRDIRHVESTEYISKAEALRILQQRLGEQVVRSPRTCPATRCRAPTGSSSTTRGNVDLVKSSLAAARRRTASPRYISPAIDEIKDREDDTKKILSATSTIKILLAALAALLVLASSCSWRTRSGCRSSPAGARSR